MAILVTGGAGYIGGHMVLALLDAGEQVVVLDDLSTGFAWAVPSAATLVVGDISDEAKLRAIAAAHHIDAIAHFAAKIVVPESVSDPLGYYLNNTVKARALLEFAVRNGIGKFIFSSTAAVYGEPAINPIFEEAPAAPINPYGRSNSWSSGFSKMLLARMGFPMWRSATSTSQAPIRKAVLASPPLTRHI
ncbi:MAG: NAD-dependent epimerase/dehydratase family protein [Methylovirgula sp.]